VIREGTYGLFWVAIRGGVKDCRSVVAHPLFTACIALVRRLFAEIKPVRNRIERVPGIAPRSRATRNQSTWTKKRASHTSADVQEHSVRNEHSFISGVS
jgi:hypothetical protein